MRTSDWSSYVCSSDLCDAIHDAAILAGSGTELIEVRGQALRTHQLAVPVDQHVPGVARTLDLFAVEEAVILVAQVAGFLRHGDLLGKAGTEAIGARHDDAVLDPQFHERSEEHTPELHSLLRISYHVFSLDK